MPMPKGYYTTDRGWQRVRINLSVDIDLVDYEEMKPILKKHGYTVREYMQLIADSEASSLLDMVRERYGDE